MLEANHPKTPSYGYQSRAKPTSPTSESTLKPRVPIYSPNKTTAKVATERSIDKVPEIKPLPDWLETDEEVSVEKINQLLSEHSSQLTKQHYKQILTKLRDLLYNKQNEDAIVRSKAFKRTQNMAEMKKEIQEKKLVLERLKKNEDRDKKYIALQQKELRHANKEQLIYEASMKSKEVEEAKKAQKDAQSFYKFTMEKFEKEFAQKELVTYDKMNSKEKEIQALLEKMKKLRLSKAFGQEKLMSDLIKYRDNKNRVESGQGVLKNLNTQIDLQDLQMKVYMALGELEALKADQEFEYLEGKLALYKNAIEKAKKEADLEGAAPSPSKDQKKDKVNLDDLYRNQSPLFDFLSDRVNPRTFYVESKEVINPHDMEDRTCVKHNEDFKDRFVKKRHEKSPKPNKGDASSKDGGENSQKDENHQERLMGVVQNIMDEVQRSIQAKKIVDNRRAELRK